MSKIRGGLGGGLGAIGLTLVGVTASVSGQAQMVPDGTLGTQVGGSCNGTGGTCVIGGGSQRGGNLFHSFQQFSLPNGDLAGFILSPDVQNAIVRVTGQGRNFISNINGTIATFNPTNAGVQLSQPVNFFLMNPNGITFGANARLFIGGAFLATTAQRMRFADGTVLDSRDPSNSPLLTVSAPIGLQMGRSPEDIRMERSYLSAGQFDNFTDFTLAGGDIQLSNTWVFTPGQRIEFGSVGSGGSIAWSANGGFQIPVDIERGNVTLANGTRLAVHSDRGGDLALTGRNINILGSALFAGINQGTGRSENQAGNLILDATDTISVKQGSQVFNLVYDTGNGNAGNIDIVTGSLFVAERSVLSTSVGGTGTAGNLTINARDAVSLDGNSLVYSIIFPGRSGQAKDIRINTGSLLVTNGSQISASTLGRGNAGSVVINARDRVVLDGTTANGQFPSFIRSSVGAIGFRENAIGQGGNIQVNTNTLTITNGANLSTSVFGMGNAGDVIINARNGVNLDGFSDNNRHLSSITSTLNGAGQGGNILVSTSNLNISNFAQLSTQTLGIGDAGDILINARNRVSLNRSGTISGAVGSNARGNGGNIQIFTGKLSMTEDAFVTTRTSGIGNAGNVIIKAQDQVALSGNDTTIDSSVRQTGRGRGGDIWISTNTLELSDGAQVIAPTLGVGNAGNIFIEARGRVYLRGSDSDTFSNTGIFSSVGSNFLVNARGDGGDVRISANTLDVVNSQLSTGTFGFGDAGNILLAIRDRVTLSGDETIIASRVEDTGRGSGGDIRIVTNTLEVLDAADLNASTLGTGDSGNVVVEARDRVVFDGGNAFSVALGATPRSTGKGGDVRVAANTLNLLNGALISSSTLSAGDAGNVYLFVNTLDVNSGAEISSSARRGNGNAGDMVIEARSRAVFDGGSVSSRVNEESNGSGGSIRINTGTLELLNGASFDSSTFGGGNAGSIAIAASDHVYIKNSYIEVFSDSLGRAGDITVATPNMLLSQGIITAEAATVDGGNVSLDVRDLLLMRSGSIVSTSAGTSQAGGNGGNITINTPNGFLVTVPNENNDITANAFNGSGGRVTVNAQGIYWFTPRSRAELVQLLGTNNPNDLDPQRLPTNDITAISQGSPTLSGTVSLNVLGTDPSKGFLQLPVDLVDAANQLYDECSPSNLGKSSFTYTGRGGIPESPDDPIRETSGLAQWILPPTHPPTHPSTPSATSPPEPIIEADRLVTSPQGTTWLVASREAWKGVPVRCLQRQ